MTYYDDHQQMYLALERGGRARCWTCNRNLSKKAYEPMPATTCNDCNDEWAADFLEKFGNLPEGPVTGSYVREQYATWLEHQVGGGK